MESRTTAEMIAVLLCTPHQEECGPQRPAFINKILLDAAIPVCLCIVYGCFLITAQLSSCDRRRSHKPKIFAVWPFTEKLLAPVWDCFTHVKRSDCGGTGMRGWEWLLMSGVIASRVRRWGWPDSLVNRLKPPSYTLENSVFYRVCELSSTMQKSWVKDTKQCT